MELFSKLAPEGEDEGPSWREGSRDGEDGGAGGEARSEDDWIMKRKRTAGKTITRIRDAVFIKTSISNSLTHLNRRY